MRYMPTFVFPVARSFVTTRGIVMNGPASRGQQVSTGSAPRSTSSPVATTSWQGPERTVFGKTEASSVNLGTAFNLSRRPSGGFGSRKNSSLWSHSSNEESSSARSIRLREAKRLIATGIVEPRTFSKRSAGAPPLTARSAISEISRCGETSVETRASSPSRSRASRKAARFRYATAPGLWTRPGKDLRLDRADDVPAHVAHQGMPVARERRAGARGYESQPLEKTDRHRIAPADRTVFHLESDSDRLASRAR